MEDIQDVLNVPPWAIERSDGRFDVVGAQLRTKDGRKCGNGYVNNISEREYLGTVIEVVTDAGNMLFLTISEVSELFYPPVFVMDVEKARSRFLFGIR